MPADTGFQNIEGEKLDFSGFFDVAVRIFKRAKVVKRVRGLVIDVQKVDRRSVLEVDHVVFPFKPSVVFGNVMELADLVPSHEGGPFLAYPPALSSVGPPPAPPPNRTKLV